MGSGCSRADKGVERGSRTAKKTTRKTRAATLEKAAASPNPSATNAPSQHDVDSQSVASVPIPALQRGESEALRQPRKQGLAFDYFGALPRIQRIGVEKRLQIQAAMETANRERKQIDEGIRVAVISPVQLFCSHGREGVSQVNAAPDLRI